MRVAMVALASLMTVTGVAEAGWNESQFAHFAAVKPDQIDAVEGYQLRGVRGYTHVLVGAYRYREYKHYAVVLLDCDRKQCRGERVSVNGGDKLELHGLVDLAGKPGPLRGERVDRSGARTRLVTMGQRRLRRPALVLEVTSETKRRNERGRYGRVSGTEKRGTLQIISLSPASSGLTRVVFRGETVSRGASGAGTTTSYRLDAGRHHGVRDLIAREQRHLDNKSRCKRPDPIEYRLIIKDQRYARAGEFAFSRGC